MTRTEKTMRNVRLALVCQVITLITNFITHRLIVSFLAPEYLSVGGLFTNIMTVLSLAELGVGASITFSLYKPLNEGDEGKLAALMKSLRYWKEQLAKAEKKVKTYQEFLIASGKAVLTHTSYRLRIYRK